MADHNKKNVLGTVHDTLCNALVLSVLGMYMVNSRKGCQLKWTSIAAQMDLVIVLKDDMDLTSKRFLQRSKCSSSILFIETLLFSSLTYPLNPQGYETDPTNKITFPSQLYPLHNQERDAIHLHFKL